MSTNVNPEPPAEPLHPAVAAMIEVQENVFRLAEALGISRAELMARAGISERDL